MTQSSLIAPHLQAFFADYLCHQKRLSPHTIVSCRDTFRLLLTFLRDHTGVEPSALRIADVDAPAVLRFLDHLEQQRGNSVRSRNIRLAAIRSVLPFGRLARPGQHRHCHAGPGHSDQAGGQKADRLSDAARNAGAPRSTGPIQVVRPARSCPALALLYNSGARVSEVITLTRAQVCFDTSTFVHLIGKGRKERTVPLWPDTAQVLKAWFRELGDAREGSGLSQCQGQAPLA